MMVLVQRLSLLAANLVDGETIRKQRQQNNLQVGNGGLPLDQEPSGGDNHIMSSSPSATKLLAPHSSSGLTALQREHAVLHLPRPLEFFSYCVNFQTVLVGPPLSFKDYLIYIEDRQADYLNTEAEKAYFLLHSLILPHLSLVQSQSQKERLRERAQVAGVAGAAPGRTTTPASSCSAFGMGAEPE
ncbi:unnamed protein product [Schistocephalus solidus]|uniref:TFIID_NTD2 domain-containing protein n=1 Tax=Schistocephalus solidus TaxID=70667 RepID=A0A183TPJ1_SCHSO|nr:unnamed protein product [Schistocephalus solidus]